LEQGRAGSLVVAPDWRSARLWRAPGLSSETTPPALRVARRRDGDRHPGRHGARRPAVARRCRQHRRKLRSRRAERFFLRASARSRLRRWTLMPKRVSTAARHSGVVSSGVAALRSTTNATTSAEILCPPLGPRGRGSKPASPAAAIVSSRMGACASRLPACRARSPVEKFPHTSGEGNVS
jgi:hypothetical protein